MTIKAKTKSGGWRKILKWASLPALILFLAVWWRQGIGLSSDTITLRRQLDGTTQVKVSFFTGSYDTYIEGEHFVLQGKEARNFVDSLLLPSKIRSFFPLTPGPYPSEQYRCEFYRGTKLVTTLSIITSGDARNFAMQNHERFAYLYPNSYGRMLEIFEKHKRGVAH